MVGGVGLLLGDRGWSFSQTDGDKGLQIVIQQGELPAAQIKDLASFLDQRRNVPRLSVVKVQARSDGVDESDSRGVTLVDQVLQFGRLVLLVKFAPARAMLEVILRCVEIGVETPALHPVGKAMALGRGPRTPVKTFRRSANEMI